MVGGAVIQQAAIKKFGARLGELETTGRFAHREGQPAYYDYAERKIVGDRQTMTQAEFDSIERIAGLSERLEANAPDPSTRARIRSSRSATAQWKIIMGGNKTHVQVDGDRKVLHVAQNARPDEILKTRPVAHRLRRTRDAFRRTQEADHRGTPKTHR